MTKVIYLIGLISTITISVGVLFRLMHWPFLTNFFLLSLIGLSFIFIPKLALDVYTSNPDDSLITKTRIISGFGGLFIILISAVFKLQHLAGANILLILGFGTFILVFLPLLFYYFANRFN